MKGASLMSNGLPTEQELEQLFTQKHGRPETTGRNPRRRFEFHYFTPQDMYEACVSRHVTLGCSWLDVGGGHSIFPENPALARNLVSRCSKMVAVDPSDNVLRNPFVHEAVQSTLEKYVPATQFELATMRMVVEHVSHPEDFVGALSRLVRPGGVAIVFTVDLWAPITVVSRLVPFGLHHPIKRLFWSGEEEDTFPVFYRMNTRATLKRLFTGAGLSEAMFGTVDDLSLFGRYRLLNYMELIAWRSLRAIGLNYPEKCLLGVYRRQ